MTLEVKRTNCETMVVPAGERWIYRRRRRSAFYSQRGARALGYNTGNHKSGWSGTSEMNLSYQYRFTCVIVVIYIDGMACYIAHHFAHSLRGSQEISSVSYLNARWSSRYCNIRLHITPDNNRIYYMENTNIF